MARRKIIAGNWKMNMTPSEAVELVNTLKPLVANEEVDVVFCVPAIDIVPVVEAVKAVTFRWVQKICTLKKKALTQAKFHQTC